MVPGTMHHASLLESLALYSADVLGTFCIFFFAGRSHGTNTYRSLALLKGKVQTVSKCIIPGDLQFDSNTSSKYEACRFCRAFGLDMNTEPGKS